MKLVTFRIDTPLGSFSRVGALHGPHVVDVNMAYARWLSDQAEAQPRRLADAQVPSNMLEFLEGGASTLAAARRALDYVTNIGASTQGPASETIFHHRHAVRLAAPLPNPSSLRDFIAFENHIAATSPPNGTSFPCTTRGITARSSDRMTRCPGRSRRPSWTMSWNWPASSDERDGTFRNGRPGNISPAIRL